MRTFRKCETSAYLRVSIAEISTCAFNKIANSFLKGPPLSRLSIPVNIAQALAVLHPYYANVTITYGVSREQQSKYGARSPRKIKIAELVGVNKVHSLSVTHFRKAVSPRTCGESKPRANTLHVFLHSFPYYMLFPFQALHLFKILGIKVKCVTREPAYISYTVSHLRPVCAFRVSYFNRSLPPTANRFAPRRNGKNYSMARRLTAIFQQIASHTNAFAVSE